METDRTAPVIASHAVSRRRALQGIGGGLAASLLLASATRSENAPPPSTIQNSFELVAEEFDWELMPGVPVKAWGYNGQVPGPEIRVREGELVQVTLRNRLPVPTTVHWHGVHLHPAMDGPAGLNQAAVPPGEEFVYEFIATPGGSRWYHSHADPQLQVPMGLYGPLIVEPKEPTRSYTYDREHTLMLGEWDMELTPGVAAGTSPRGPRDQTLRGGELGADMFLVNGHAHGGIAPVVVKEGERVLLRMINAGHMAHPIHLHGHSFKIVATDGNPIPQGMEWTKDTILIGPAERYDLELTANNPGVWMFHCHIEHHMANGMMTVLQYEGEVPTGPAADLYSEVVSTGHHGHPATNPATPQPVTPDPVASSDPAAQNASGASVTIGMLDDRFDPATVTIFTGTTVSWVNRGANWHSIAAFDGRFTSEKLAPGASFEHRFDTSGECKYLCQHHALQGMTGVIRVNDP